MNDSALQVINTPRLARKRAARRPQPLLNASGLRCSVIITNIKDTFQKKTPASKETGAEMAQFFRGDHSEPPDTAEPTKYSGLV